MRGCLVVQWMCGGWPADHTRSQTRSTYTTQLLRYRNFSKVVNFSVVLCTLRRFSRLYYYLGNLAFLFVSVRPFSPYFLAFPDFRFSPLYHLRSTVHPLCATFFHSLSTKSPGFKELGSPLLAFYYYLKPSQWWYFYLPLVPFQILRSPVSLNCHFSINKFRILPLSPTHFHKTATRKYWKHYFSIISFHF